MPMTMRRLEVDGHCMQGVIGFAIAAVILHEVIIETETNDMHGVAEAKFLSEPIY